MLVLGERIVHQQAARIANSPVSLQSNMARCRGGFILLIVQHCGAQSSSRSGILPPTRFFRLVVALLILFTWHGFLLHPPSCYRLPSLFSLLSDSMIVVIQLLMSISPVLFRSSVVFKCMCQHVLFLKCSLTVSNLHAASSVARS